MVSGLYLHLFLLAWPYNLCIEWDLIFKPKSQDQQWQKSTLGSTIVCCLEQLFLTVLLHLGLITPGEMQGRDTCINGGMVGEQNSYTSFLNGLGFTSGKQLNYSSGPINLSKVLHFEKSQWVRLLYQMLRAQCHGICLVKSLLRVARFLLNSSVIQKLWLKEPSNSQV